VDQDWKMTKISKFILSVLLMPVLTQPLFGYGNRQTHPFMSERSVDILAPDDNNPYNEIRIFKSQIRDGSIDEDGIVGERGRLHFYYPPTADGLVLYGLGFPSALETGQTAWNNAIHFYMASVGSTGFADRSEAYHDLGSVLHLFAQDMSSPPHVNNDIHVPHAFGFGGDDAPLENRGEVLTSNSRFPGGTQVQGIDLTNPHDFGIAVANQTYQNSVLPGSLSRSQEKGEIILPDDVHLFVGFHEGDSNSDDPLVRADRWVIPIGNSVNKDLGMVPVPKGTPLIHV